MSGGVWSSVCADTAAFIAFKIPGKFIQHGDLRVQHGGNFGFSVFLPTFHEHDFSEKA